MYAMMQPMRPRSTHKLDSTQNDYAVASNLLGDFPTAWGGDIIIHVTNSATIGTASGGTPTTNAALESISCGPMAASSVLIDSGCIVSGRGGAGGAAGGSCAAGSAGAAGASGLRTDNSMQVQNNGSIYGAGGGGGGTGGSSSDDNKSCGCDTAVGPGGSGQGSQGAAGTRGGAYGANGSAGPAGTNGGCGAGAGGAGGAAGNYAIGFSLMTFTVAGTTAGGTTG